MTHKLAALFPIVVWRYIPSLTRKETTTIHLTSARLRAFVLATFLLGLVTAAPMASAAEWNDHSGTVCKNYNASDVGYIDYLSYGTRSLSPSYTYLVCPVTRNTTGSFGALFYVYVTSNLTTYCTAYSYTYYGSLIASGSNSGTGLIGISLYGAGNSDTLSNYSVFCYLPGNGAAVLNTVDIFEY